MRSYLRNVFPSLLDIDDLVQESFARVMRAHEAGKVIHARAFLFTTARNAALDIFRRRSVVTIEGIAHLEKLNVFCDSPDAADALNKQQELSLLADAVQSLPGRCREVMTLRLLHALPQKDIAEKFGVSEHTIKNQLAMGMRRCADFLESRGVGIPRHRSHSARSARAS